MKKKNTTLTSVLFVTMVFLMPFIFVSCEKEDVVPGQDMAFGYHIGFPLAIVKFFINPVHGFKFFPEGLVDLVLLALFICGIYLAAGSVKKIYPAFMHGWRWMAGYITAHFLYNIYYPIYYAYGIGDPDKTGMMGGDVCYALIFPFIFMRDKLDKNFQVTKDMFGYERVNFLLSCAAYFLLGAIIFYLFHRGLSGNNLLNVLSKLLTNRRGRSNI